MKKDLQKLLNLPPEQAVFCYSTDNKLTSAAVESLNRKRLGYMPHNAVATGRLIDNHHCTIYLAQLDERFYVIACNSEEGTKPGSMPPEADRVVTEVTPSIFTEETPYKPLRRHLLALMRELQNKNASPNLLLTVLHDIAFTALNPKSAIKPLDYYLPIYEAVHGEAAKPRPDRPVNMLAGLAQAAQAGMKSSIA